MTILNTVYNTAIVNNAYVSRGLVAHGAMTRNAVRAKDGTLYVAVLEGDLEGQVALYRSANRGFSWDRVWKGDFPNGTGWGFEKPVVSGERAQGGMLSVNLFERLNRLFIWVPFNYSTTNNRVWPFIIDLTTMEDDPDDEVPSNATDYQVDADELNIRVTYNLDTLFMCYLKANDLYVRHFAPYRPTLQQHEDATALGNLTTSFDAAARKDGKVDIAIATTSEQVRYIRYDAATGTFTSPVNVGPLNNYTQDVNVHRDGQGSLLVAWADGHEVHVALSSDDGASWSAFQVAAGAGFTDSVVAAPARRVAAQPGLEGFLLTYVSDRGTPRTYVRTVEADGTTGEEREVATASNPDKPVVGGKFFLPPADYLLDLSNPGQARIAYQVGEGNSNLGQDTKPVRYGQERLDESAYPSPWVVEEGEPIVDDPEDHQRLVTLNVIPGPSPNVDYHALGATGEHTKHSLRAFERIGVPLRVLRYDPNREAEVNDQSAYGKPSEQVVKAIVTPLSYEQPFAATNDPFTTFVERDARKVHLPPDFHLEREFILNEGNHLKRTVWTFFYDGNEYEMSQVVPYFYQDQIINYTANAYVVGPSNDPFSRVTLPSET